MALHPWYFDLFVVIILCYLICMVWNISKPFIAYLSEGHCVIGQLYLKFGLQLGLIFLLCIGSEVYPGIRLRKTKINLENCKLYIFEDDGYFLEFWLQKIEFQDFCYDNQVDVIWVVLLVCFGIQLTMQFLTKYLGTSVVSIPGALA